ncbi:MAG: translocation/assembly module TamB [Rhodobacteraceae bacterium]|nr:translocation/assembly module TamB [Paracoccaceae bacterium]
MKRLLALLPLLFCLSLPAHAQDDDEGTRLERLIEGALSSDGTTVRVRGFRGALSSEATLDRMTIADEQGIWLTLEDAELNWSRAALLTGRVEVSQITAQRLEVARLPAGGSDAPAPEASGGSFSLPDLPVSVNIGEMSIERVELGEPILGEAVALGVAGSAQLADGEGEAQLSVQRLDGPRDAITFDGSYVNESRQLAIDLAVDGAQDGLVTKLANLPGAPALKLTVNGEGPVDDFTADVALATDGEDRFSGTVTLEGVADEGQRFAADLSGDLRPLLPEDQRAFLGASQSIETRGMIENGGAIQLDALDLETATVSLDGSARIGADGWPERLLLDGRIASEDGEPVQIAFTQDVTRLDQATLRLFYDRAQGDEFTLRALVEGLDRPEMALERATLSGQGTIARNAGSSVPGQVSGQLSLALEGLDLADASLADATGRDLRGGLQFDWQEGAPFEITGIDLNGAGIEVAGDVTLFGLSEGNDPTVEPYISVRTDDLSRFSGVAGRDLGGAANFVLEGTMEPVAGRFDLSLSGTADDLSADIEQLDGLLAGRLTLAASAERNEGGTFLRQLDLDGRSITLSANGQLKTGESSGTFDLTLPDLSLVDPNASGQLTASGTLDEGEAAYALDLEASGPGDTRIDGVVTARKGEDGGIVGVGFDGTADSQRLAAFAPLIDRPLAGGLTFDGSGSYTLETGYFDTSGTLVTQDLEIGIPQVDGLLQGTTRAEVDAVRDDGGITIRDARVNGPGIRMTANGTLLSDASTATFDITLPELSRAAAGMTGSASLQGELTESADAYLLDFSASGPGQTGASGELTATKSDDGSGPMGVASVSFDGTAEAGALSAFAPLVGRTLRGSLDFDGGGSYTLESSAFSAEGRLTTQDIALGIPTVDQLIGGTGRAVVSARRDADGTITVDTLDVTTSQISATMSGSLGQSGNSALSYDVVLNNLGVIVEQLPGRATATGTLSGSGSGPWQVNTDLTAPGGTQARVTGSIAQSFDNANLGITGSAPLSLANTFIEPNLLSGLARLDLRLDGPLAPASLSGTIRVDGAEAVLPGPALSLTGLDIETLLGGGQAQVSVTGGLSTGGTLETTGTIGMTAPYRADLAVRLRDLLLEDRRLYQARADGRITVEGPLLTGPAIGGWVEINEAELRIPETGMGPGSRSFTLNHVAEPSDVRATRARAGLLEQSGDGGGGSAYSLPLDLEIRAPARIFVRGRGLDAELGGTLRLRGTSQDIVPEGRFDLIRGRLDILGQRLTLERAVLRLTGDFIPTIEVEAVTERDGNTITVAIEGEATSPEVSFSSTPSRPEEEVLALLLFGRNVGELSAFQALRIAAAVNTLAGRGGEGIIGNLRQGFGLDDFDVTTDAEGNAGLRAGKYLSENIYTDVEVDSSGETSIDLNLQVNKNVKARGRATSAGDTSLGIFYEKDY